KTRVADVDLIKVERLEKVVAATADVSDFERHVKADLALNADVKLLYHRHFEPRIDRKDRVEERTVVVSVNEGKRRLNEGNARKIRRARKVLQAAVDVCRLRSVRQCVERVDGDRKP